MMLQKCHTANDLMPDCPKEKRLRGQFLTERQFAKRRRVQVAAAAMASTTKAMSERDLQEATADAWVDSMGKEENHMETKEKMRPMEAVSNSVWSGPGLA